MSRREEAYDIRVRAADIARNRDHPVHISNGEEKRYRDDDNRLTHIGTFTKGLPHNRNTGLLSNPSHFEAFVNAINTGDVDDIKKLKLGPLGVPRNRRFRSGIASRNDTFKAADVRAWESMGAGLAFDLEGPDAQAVTMPPAPTLDSDELVAEMTESYWMALLRDTNFTDFGSSDMVEAAVDSLNNTEWIRRTDTRPQTSLHNTGNRRSELFKPDTVFRGITPGDDVGPYISQFLLAGTEGLGKVHKITDGYIQYGGMRMDQRVRTAVPNRDYMTTWESFLDVQNGADLAGRELYEDGKNAYRFITTPRDLATYVHYDALYQAYLNACIIMLNMKVKFDEGIPFGDDDDVDKQQGFAHFGGPHILSLVTEVATRALKAVRFQKFNTHRRLRPEAVGGLIERYHNEPDNSLFAGVARLYNELDEDLLARIASENRRQNKRLSDYGNPREEDFSPEGQSRATRLLPMAFAEGSPMHPAYGAGHATVAGACVTVLKAFFDTTHKFEFCLVPNESGSQLVDMGTSDRGLTVEGELNKLCSNVSIGRNWAGVHYFSDYRESIKIGEEIAIGILEEQKILFGEKFTMTIPKFDGTTKVIRKN